MRSVGLESAGTSLLSVRLFPDGEGGGAEKIKLLYSFALFSIALSHSPSLLGFWR